MNENSEQPVITELETEQQQPQQIQVIDYSEELTAIITEINELSEYFSERDKQQQENDFTYKQEQSENREKDLQNFQDYLQFQTSIDESNQTFQTQLLEDLQVISEHNQTFDNVEYVELLNAQNSKLDTLSDSIIQLAEVSEPNQIALENQELERYAYLSIILVVCVMMPVYLAYKYIWFFFKLIL